MVSLFVSVWYENTSGCKLSGATNLPLIDTDQFDRMLSTMLSVTLTQFSAVVEPQFSLEYQRALAFSIKDKVTCANWQVSAPVFRWLWCKSC